MDMRSDRPAHLCQTLNSSNRNALTLSSWYESGFIKTVVHLGNLNQFYFILTNKKISLLVLEHYNKIHLKVETQIVF